uniref:Est10 n=1 Tax=uncultured marine bacterium TaxID=56765 RepID=D2KLA3_9BACT|nr:Est10 [uncultured marine bacterium]
MVSQQLTEVIEELRAGPKFADMSVEEQRAAMDDIASQFELAEDVNCEPVDAGGVPAEWITAPGAATDRVIYYLHGGGYVFGSISSHRELISRLSRAAGARGLAIDYRLAPEHPFPAAIEDSTAGYRWLLSSGVDPSRIVIAGDSAGGGLTVATLLALRDAGDPMPAAAVCLSPWVDLEGLGESMTTKADADPMVERRGLLQSAEAYLDGADPRTPLAAPLYGDFKGLPPLLIQVGTAETLLDDSTRLAERAKSAGVAVVLEPWDDMIHVWQFFAATVPEAQQAIERIGEFSREHQAARSTEQVTR